ncbi:MAG: adenylate/guanylate cyclase domain-containing protein [Myxococcota bacterium]
MTDARLERLHCRRCGRACTPEDRYCSECGSRIPRACDDCGFPNAHDARYCVRCGAEQSIPQDERKFVTVLFADIEGSTAMIAGMDPELAEQRMEPALAAMRNAVSLFGGTVNRMVGDGIMALFGAPTAVEDHAVRACCAALEMTRVVSEMSEPELRIRVGLHSGEVVLRQFDNDLATDYDAVGDTPHLANRMEQLADPNTTWITEETRRLAEGRIETRPIGKLRVEGFTSEVMVHQLVGGSMERGSWEIRTARGLSGFVGRPSELETLLGHADAAVRGHGAVATLSGEAGIGKSRLSRELATRAEARGLRVAIQSAAANDRPSSYRLISRWLRTWLSERPEDSQDAVAQRLADFAATHRIDASHLPALESLLDLHVGDARWDQLDPAQRAARISAALVETVRRVSEREPQLVVLEDLHLADRETLTALAALAPSLERCRALLLLTHRPEAGLDFPAPASRLTLGPLGAAEAQELASTLVGSDARLDELKQLLLRRAGGNPLFLEESVRSLVDRGHLVGEPGGYELHAHLRTLDVPESIHAIIASRIDALDAEHKSTLQTAAVVGREFTLRLLGAVDGAPASVLDARLARLEAGGFVAADPDGGDRETLAFRHSLIQEVAYRGLLGPLRRELHGRVMEAIEQIHAGRLAEHTHALAEHAFAGGLWNQAARYRLLSCQSAIARSASREAIERYDRAIEELDEMPETPTTLKAAIDLRLVILNAFLPVGEHARMLHDLLDAEKLAQSIADERRLGVVRSNLAMAFWLSGDHERGLRTAESARESAERLDNSALALGSTFNLGIIHHAQGRHETAVEIQRGVLERLRGAREDDRMNWGGYPGVFVRTFMGQSLLELGRVDDAERCVREGRNLAERVDHPYSLAMIDSVVGQLLLATVSGDEARERLDAALHAALEHEVLTMRPLLAARLASAWVAGGDAGRALAAIDPVLDPAVYRRSGAYIWADVFLAASEAYAASGELGEAARFAGDAEDLCRRTGARGQLAHTLVQLSVIAFRRGEPVRAEALRREAAALAEELSLAPLLRRVQV